MAQPCAVIDIVGAEAGADQLLEDVGFLVGTLGRTETGQRIAAMGVPDVTQALRCKLQCLFPARFPEVGERVERVHVDALLKPWLADQRLGQPLR